MRLRLLPIMVACVCLPIPARGAPVSDRMAGFCFEGPPRRPEADPMPEMAVIGANWVSLTPFGFMRQDTEPTVHLRTEGGWWGEVDEGVIQSARWAHAAGMRVMLKPHIWIRGRGGQWRGTIHMTSEEDWDRWFNDYETWIGHYADLAEREGIEALVVGHELSRAALDPAREQSWRRVIASVRERYSGPLLWSAHWEAEFEQLPFWDALDMMGVSVYFPVSNQPSPSVADLQARWAGAARRIAEIAAERDMPVVFTELGYRSSSDAAAMPWLWRSEAPADPALQSELYEAMLAACWDEPWFAGVFVWKWLVPARMGRGDGRGFTPQGKPAMDVLRRWFTAAGGEAPESLPSG